MTLNELEIMERTAQAKCGSSYIVSLDPLKPVGGEKAILLRIQDKEDMETVLPCVLDADCTLSEVCDLALAFVEDLKEVDM